MIRAGLLIILFGAGVAAEALTASPAPTMAGPPVYPWLAGKTPEGTIAGEIAPPPDYVRVAVPGGSFGEWLRNLPLKPSGTPVRLYDGRRKRNQGAHAAVVDIDVGRQDLQQCADAIIRLRAEYLYSRGMSAAIHFNFTSGDKAAFTKWADGYRPMVHGSNVTWQRRAPRSGSYATFRSYLETVFMYAGTLSLTKELKPVARIEEMQIGDVFIRGGSPGHAVIVVDMVEGPADGRRLFLLAQSYMPAQDVHVLRNPDDPALSPWYSTDFSMILDTPEWIFHRNELARFEPESQR